ncbi:LAFE_0C01838g1_1 [Lachancea fermentati]|uniref:LAFE_0C01838g1_1 n=1 Tax=Lachancea fermentati TaxID=4955 RepID=A0A1G4M924_LACFM|nr:LAFE_0C01838g1_1 [Lachancea fermentati]
MSSTFEEKGSELADLKSLSVPSRVKAFFWGRPPKDPKERKLLLKIDCLVMTYVCLNYWINYVDRSNLANAYVSGMKEDLNMVGDQYNIINTCFTVGYVVGMIPNNLILLKVPPRYWLSFCSLAWALLTLGMYKVSSYHQLCAIRFFQAIFESSTFSGTHLILGSWYKEEEINTRSATFTSSGLVGSIFSGFMQSAIYNNMDGKNGISGWRWLFIIDFIITIPICVYGFLCFPGLPGKSKPSWVFSQENLDMAKARLPPREETKLDWSVFKRVVGRWHWWLFSLLWVLGGENESFGSNSLLSLWLKYNNYSVAQRNHYPMGIFGVGITATYFSALYVDHTRGKNHWHIALLISATLVVVSIMILAKPLSDGVMFTAQYLSGISYAGQASFFAWANVVCRRDMQERAVVLASMNMFSGAVNAWWSLLFYAATTVPEFKKGCYAMLATTISAGFVAIAIRYLQVREDKQAILDKHDSEMGQISYENPTESDVVVEKHKVVSGVDTVESD